MEDQNNCCGLVKIFKRPDHWEPTEQAPIPLISVDIIASIVHAVAQVEVMQVYVNQEEQPIEAIYYFPVNPDGAVTHFQAELEGKIIKGVVKPHEEAKAAFEKAIENKKTAFLGEETKADIFKIRVGFLKPGAQAKIIIGYVTEVKNDPGSNAIRFYIPNTVAPRYVSPTEADDVAEDFRKMQFSASSPASLTLKVAISLQGKIKSVESSTHPVKVTKSKPISENPTWEKAIVELSGKTTDMDRDFVLNISPEQTHKPQLYSETLENGSTAVMLHLVPSFKLDEQKTELIFVLDRSGSMRGSSIELAKKALLLFLHSMPVDCYFNVVGFGSSYEFLFPNSVKYDDESLQKATNYANQLQADLGGTEIFKPLKDIYGKPNVEGYLRQIFILTDGQVSNTDAVIGIAKSNAHKARVFALGIGDVASHYLVEGVAKAGGGTSAFVSYNESIDKKVLNQLKNALQPSLTDIELKWEGVELDSVKPEVSINKEKTLLGYNKPIEVDPICGPAQCTSKQAPKRIPPVYDGSQLLVFGIFSEVPKSVTITAQSPDGPLSLNIEHSSDCHVGSMGMLHRLAAVKLVRELELEIAGLRYQVINVAQQEELKKEIIAIACQNGITSKYTSFVAIDESVGKPSEESWVMETRHVPSQVASERQFKFHARSGGFELARRIKERVRQCNYVKCGPSDLNGSNSSPSQFCSDSNTFGSIMEKASVPGGALMPTVGCRSTDLVTLCCPLPDGERFREQAEREKGRDIQKVEDLSTTVEKIICLQLFDGSYSLEEKLCLLLGKPLAELQQAALRNNLQETVLATSLAIYFFTTKLAAEKEVWELVVLKARKWLATAISSPEKVVEVIQIASTIL